MRQDRFAQLQRFLHVSPYDPTEPPDPTQDEIEKMNSEQLRQLNKMWWRKLEPLISTFRANCQAHWIPGSNVSVDEMMIKFYGRLKYTLKMKNKPIKQGFKIWALCEGGYLYSFLFYSRLWKTGELKQHELLTNTGAVVY